LTPLTLGVNCDLARNLDIGTIHDFASKKSRRLLIGSH